jgi:TPR repeat protein
MLFILLAFLNFATASEPSHPPDPLKAKWSQVSTNELLKAAENGNGEAQYYLGASEWAAALTEADYSRSLWSSNRLAQQQISANGNADANHARWAAVSEAEAMQAAQAGDPGAQLFIKQIEYERARDRGLKAFQWLKRAADQSVAPAEYEVATRYLGFSGWVTVPSDKKPAIDLLRRAAAQGNEGAQHRLANIFIEGDLLPIDLPQGIELLRKAADQGCPRAQFELAQEYACGNGDPRSDIETPVALLSKSAKAGWSDAQFTLAERYRTGFNVQTNNAKAFFWYSQAASNGVAKAFLQCNKLKGSLSAEDCEQVRLLTEELRARSK